MTETDQLKKLFHSCMPFFIALGDEIRLTIVEVLTEAAFSSCEGDFSPENLSRHGMNVKAITERTSLSRPAVSHHLKVLKDAGLIGSSRAGTCNYYYLTTAEATSSLVALGRKLQSLLSMKEDTDTF